VHGFVYNVQVRRLLGFLLFSTVLFPQNSTERDTRVILLGTGTPNPDPDRMGPAVAVVTAGRVYIVDCGPGMVRRAVQAGIDMNQLTRVFFTHLHSDHTAGYPDLILTPPNAGRTAPLEAYGPPGLREMTANLIKAYKVDLDVRIRGSQPHYAPAFEVRAHDVKPGEIYRDDAVRVIAFAVPHGDFPGAFGYRFEAGDKVIVISGDTTYSEALIAAAKGCDILVHEVYSKVGLDKRTPDWRRYHAAFHTSGPDVGRVAAQVRPRKLVLYHLLPMGESDEQVLNEVRSKYDGQIIYGKDLDVIR
jgi:ribonuclease BN (tRNA processing enzyme)